MKSIGTASNGALLLEATAEELRIVDGAIAVLVQWRAAFSLRESVPTGSQLGHTPAKTSARIRICKHCGKQVDSPTGLQCRACMNRIYNQPKKSRRASEPKGVSSEKAFTPKDHKLSGRVTKATTTAPRERDPALDRPISAGGRVLPVGAQE